MCIWNFTRRVILGMSGVRVRVNICRGTWLSFYTIMPFLYISASIFTLYLFCTADVVTSATNRQWTHGNAGEGDAAGTTATCVDVFEGGRPHQSDIWNVRASTGSNWPRACPDWCFLLSGTKYRGDAACGRTDLPWDIDFVREYAYFFVTFCFVWWCVIMFVGLL